MIALTVASSVPGHRHCNYSISDIPYDPACDGSPNKGLGYKIMTSSGLRSFASPDADSQLDCASSKA